MLGRSLFGSFGEKMRPRGAHPAFIHPVLPRPVLAEPLEERLLMALSKAAGGSGYSGTLSANAVTRQQQLICDPAEPLEGTTSVEYNPDQVTLRGFVRGPGYDNQAFGGVVEVLDAAKNQPVLQSLVSFLDRPFGRELGYAQVHYRLSDGASAGQIDPPRDQQIVDEGGTDGVDPFALNFLVNPNLPGDAAIRYRVFAAGKGTHADNEEDFMIPNDGSGKRIPASEISPAIVSTRPQDGSLNGTAYEDMNGDGSFGRGDRLLPKATVFLDLNRNEKLDDQEPVQISDEEGHYLFDDLRPGAYVVRAIPPDEFVERPTEPDRGFYVVEVVPGIRQRGNDFGFVRLGRIGGTVFNDLNGNGGNDNEPPLRDATVYLDLNHDGQLGAGEPSSVSNPNGVWSIGNLMPGVYTVRQIPPAGFVQTFPAASPAYVVGLSSGESDTDQVFGDKPVVGPRVEAVFVGSGAWTAPFRQYLANVVRGDAAAGYAVPAVDQLDPLPWTGLNQVSIRFDGPVSVLPRDLEVHGLNVRTYATTGVSYNAATQTATWTLAQPFINDRVTLTVHAGPGGVSSVVGAPLDGEWRNGADAFPSGDGSPGGDFAFGVNVLPGDVNHSGGVNAVDLSQVRAMQLLTTTNRGYSPFHDVNGSGGINAVDLGLVRANQLKTLPRVIIFPPPILPLPPVVFEPSVTWAVLGE